MKSFTEKPLAIVTTIQAPTQCMRQLSEKIKCTDMTLVVVGDAKGPIEFPLEGCRFLSLRQQQDIKCAIVRNLPINHYARKNIGYIYAMQQRAAYIYETDDDNKPNCFWRIRNEEDRGLLIGDEGWVNVYRYFSNNTIWPRGFPLDEIVKSSKGHRPQKILFAEEKFPIQQGLADVAPDVDAIWRLTHSEEVIFNRNESVVLGRNRWCPFNSQSTWWWPAAYPLLYLPSFCSFRMTDIWRSFVAQRCLWELGYKLIFHPSDVCQERNAHVIMRDFADEIPGYLSNQAIKAMLMELPLKSGYSHLLNNMRICYEAMVNGRFIGDQELMLVNDWIQDMQDTWL